MVQEINLYNDKLKELIEEHGKKQFCFTCVGDNIGYCYLYIHERNKQREEEEEKARADEYYEVECSACGDGGCIHCEPQFFI